MTVQLSSLALPCRDPSNTPVQAAHLISTNRLKVVPQSQLRSDPVRVFEILSSVGEIQSIDFSHVQIDQIVIVTYFDLRAARKALLDLRGDFKLLEPDTSYDSSSARSVRIKRDSNLSLDDTMNALSVYGEIERISFSGTDQLVIEFFDTRGPIAVMTALSSSGAHSTVSGSSYSRPSIGGEARKANYSDPPVCMLSVPPSTSCSSVVAGDSGNSATEFDIRIDAVEAGLDKRTTLMIRNIPNKYTQKVLLRLIDLMFKDKYDFFYLPIDYKHRCNVGYAFINFTGETFSQAIPLFYTLFNNKKWDKFNSEKVSKISYARLQGQDALLEHFKSSSVMQQHKQLRPFFTRQGSTESTAGSVTGLQLVPPGLTPSDLNTGSVIESVWSETSGSAAGPSTAIPPLAALNLGTVEGTVYAAVHQQMTV